MFLQLMEHAVAQLRGQPLAEPLDPEVHISLSAFIPTHYISDIDQRLSTYRQLAQMEKLEMIGALKSDLIDRFGQLPDEVNHLLFKIMLKVQCRLIGVKRLDLGRDELVLLFSENHLKNNSRLLTWAADNKKNCQFAPSFVAKDKTVKQQYYRVLKTD